MYRYRIGKKCVKELQQNLFTAHGVLSLKPTNKAVTFSVVSRKMFH